PARSARRSATSPCAAGWSLTSWATRRRSAAARTSTRRCWRSTGAAARSRCSCRTAGSATRPRVRARTRTTPRRPRSSTSWSATPLLAARAAAPLAMPGTPLHESPRRGDPAGAAARSLPMPRHGSASGGLRPRLGALFQRALRRTAEAPLTFGNAATLLVDGTAAFPAMLETIAGARRRVIFENYIIRDDDVGRRFARALAERARAGVEVFVLYDWLGCMRTGHAFWDELRRASCHVRCFAPPSLRHPFRVLRRDHRKLVLADARVAIVGGLCIGNEWDD